MKKYKYSVKSLYYPENTSYLLLHPFRSLERLPWYLKAKRDRVRKGFCDADWKNLYEWYLEIVPEMIKMLAMKGITAPISFEREDRWRDLLYELSLKFAKCRNDEVESRNEYKQMFLNNFKSLTFTMENGLNEIVRTRDTKLGEEIADKYFNREKELTEERDKDMHEAFEMFEKYFFSLWD